jgi:hypothetical protein
MTDLDVAVMTIKAAAAADSGCQHCAGQVVEEAMKISPHLPWRLAAEGLFKEHGDEYEYALFAVGSPLTSD